MSAQSPVTRSVLSLSVGLSLIIAAGCSGGSAKGTVNGKVVANGQPVTEGTILFAPAAGLKATAAQGQVKPDGTFQLSTDKENDGAAIGKHQVSYSAPPDQQAEWDGYGTPPPVKKSPFAGMVPKEAQVEVKSGKNEITIELAPAGQR